jgi:hypothetical protein
MKQSNRTEDAYANGNSHSYYSRMNISNGDHLPHDPRGTQQSIVSELCHNGHAGNTSVTLTPNATLLDGQLAPQPLQNYSNNSAASRSGATETRAWQNSSA